MIPRFLLLIVTILGLGHAAWAADFDPDLGQPLEVIDGGKSLDVVIPADAPERSAYPVQVFYSRPLLTELPGRPFRQVEPPPEWPAFWMYPLYAGLGFPRDLVDGFFGAIVAKVPVFSTAGYVVYEMVPTQILFRDPRDWHRWDGNQNKKGHGYYDGNKWGFFPSLNTWDFSYPSRYAARRNARKNTELQTELNKRNREIEAENMRHAETLREARRQALAAIEAGNGAEAVRRTLPAREAYPQEEGVFALYIAALALYADQQAPEWVAPVLWQQLNTAQPRPLAAAERLLAQTATKQPNAFSVGAALVYARELQGQRKPALEAAQRLLSTAPGEARRERLVMEAALSASNLAAAQPIYDRLRSQQLNQTEQALLIGRTDLLRGNYESALQLLTPLAEANPEDGYYNYYLGVAQMRRAEANNERDDYQKAFTSMERAALQAPNAALRLRAGQALAYLRGVLAGIRQKPELFNADSTTTATLAP